MSAKLTSTLQLNSKADAFTNGKPATKNTKRDAESSNDACHNKHTVSQSPESITVPYALEKTTPSPKRLASSAALKLRSPSKKLKIAMASAANTPNATEAPAPTTTMAPSTDPTTKPTMEEILYHLDFDRIRKEMRAMSPEQRKEWNMKMWGTEVSPWANRTCFYNGEDVAYEEQGELADDYWKGGSPFYKTTTPPQQQRPPSSEGSTSDKHKAQSPSTAP